VERDRFLSRVGDAARRAPLPGPPDVSPIPPPDEEDLVELFTERATSVNAGVHGPVSAAGAPSFVADIVSDHGCESFISWDDLPAAGVSASLGAIGCERIAHHVYDGERLQHQLGYRHLDCGITGADAGLAESGSVVLLHGVGRPRMASLVPEIHISLLPTDLIHRSLAHWAHGHPQVVPTTANLVIVSGPSRTGDIELQLNLGVHGPRIVHIVLIER
jgi:L-lactate dehydrogenase complex protein LldG